MIAEKGGGWSPILMIIFVGEMMYDFIAVWEKHAI